MKEFVLFKICHGPVDLEKWSSSFMDWSLVRCHRALGHGNGVVWVPSHRRYIAQVLSASTSCKCWLIFFVFCKSQKQRTEYDQQIKCSSCFSIISWNVLRFSFQPLFRNLFIVSILKTEIWFQIRSCCQVRSKLSSTYKQTNMNALCIRLDLCPSFWLIRNECEEETNIISLN